MLRGRIYRIDDLYKVRIIKILSLYISVSSFFFTYGDSLMVSVSKHLSLTLFVMINQDTAMYIVILELVNITEVARKS